MTRRLTPAQASAVYDVLVEHTGALEADREWFVRRWEKPYPFRVYPIGDTGDWLHIGTHTLRVACHPDVWLLARAKLLDGHKPVARGQT